jgi:hypothetical protein
MSEEVTYMDCAQFEEVLHDLDRPGTEEFALRENALAHAESCSRCARLLTEAESLDFGLRKLAVQNANQQASPRVESVLLQEFRRQKIASNRQWIQWEVAALGAAALVLLALGLSFRHGVVTRHDGSSGTNLAGNHAPLPSSAGTTAALGTSQPFAAQPNAQQDETAEDQSGDTESATAFVSLPYADTPAALEDGAIVRVVLSRSTLASFGIPVADMGNAEPIPADLVVSADGTPQAIRLVSQANLD